MNILSLTVYNRVWFNESKMNLRFSYRILFLLIYLNVLQSPHAATEVIWGQYETNPFVFKLAQSPSSFHKGLSLQHYNVLGGHDGGIVWWNHYKTYLDLASKYGANMTRIFAYAPPDAPFSSDIQFQRLKEFVEYANSKEICVIVDLFWDNVGSDTPDITSKDKEELKTYIGMVVETLKGRCVIFETVNEIEDYNFQRFVLSELKKYGVMTSTYIYDMGASYRNIHGCDRYSGLDGDGRYLHSTDVWPCQMNLSDTDIIQIMRDARDKGGHFELHLSFNRDTAKPMPLSELEAHYRTVLDAVMGIGR